MKLEIYYDHYAECPFDNYEGYCLVTKYQVFGEDEYGLRDILLSTYETASSAREHFQKVKNKARYDGIKGLWYFPVVKYEHSSVRYSVGTTGSCPWDSGFNGILVCKERTSKKQAESILKTFTNWANGEAYGFSLLNEDGEVLDGCSGFYSLDDLQENLPSEFGHLTTEDLEKMLIASN